MPETSITAFTCILEHVHLADLEEGQIIPPSSCPIIDPGRHSNEMSEIMYRLFKKHTEPDTFAYERIQLEVAKLILLIHDCFISAPKKTDRPVESLACQIKHYIDRNYNQKITIDSLSQRFFASPSLIAHEMKKEFGISPIQYLIDRRIGEAHRYLLYSDKTMYEIAQLVGYEDVNYFNRLFTRRTGFTSSEIRK